MTSPRIAGLVLAGGQSRRMAGRDKPLIALAGRPMLAWVVDALGLAETAISANGDPARFARFGRPVLADGGFAGHGPLAGLLAGLDWAAGLGADAVLSAPADTPFLPGGLPDLLLPAPRAAVSNGRKHHLVACWPTAVRDPLRAWLSAPNPRRAEAFAVSIGMQYRHFGDYAADPFANVNTQADLRAARLRVAGLDAGYGIGSIDSAIGFD